MNSCGPFPTQYVYVKSNYFHLILDDFLNYGDTALLTAKNQVVKHFKTEAQLELKLGNKVKAVRCDGAKQFVAGTLCDHLDASGIILQSTAAYAHQQNGKAERYICTIKDMVQSLMTESGLPLSFVGTAILIAQYLRNCIPTSTLPALTTPFELVEGKKPDLSHLQVWSCQCFVLHPLETCPYNLFNMKRVVWAGKYYFSHDVIFNKNICEHKILISKLISSTEPIWEETVENLDAKIEKGHFTKFNGTGGESIYGSSFVDEDLERPLDAEALLCMANKGPNTNNSQFFITLRECPHLNGKHVVFGRVIRGFDIVQKISTMPVDGKSRPLTPVVISNCGELELRKPPAKPPTEEPSKSEKRSHRRSISLSVSRSPSPERRRHRKKKKSKRKHSRSRSLDRDSPPSKSDAPREETEEEYDARLEREEKERLEEARKKELQKIKEKYEKDLVSNSGGVRFKGRGRMKFVDPELMHRYQDSR
ncbi:Peptidyl-prolyl cis-trans isomerase cyp11 [Termitomyces sp. J132]|nr:Peptidyl-prolyl cis-trans isomerase cyp11 [Termitomyces sp. J132]